MAALRAGLPVIKKVRWSTTLSRFHRIPERSGRTDGQTDRFATSITRVSVLTRDKNESKIILEAIRQISVSRLIWKSKSGSDFGLGGVCAVENVVGSCIVALL